MPVSLVDRAAAAGKFVGRVWPRDRRGISALEFGLIAPVMATLFLAAVDVGYAVQQSIQLQQAIYAGALYARANPTGDATIISKVSNDIPAAWNAGTPTVSAVACTCVSATTGVPTPVACATGCTGSSILTRSRTLSVSMTYSPFLLTNITTLSASYVMRYQ
jgi:Flp pilus assembly protein TadG